MDIRKFLESAAEKRLDDIIFSHREEDKKGYEHLTELYKELEPKSKEQVNEYMEEWNAWSSEEMIAVYLQAFFDGLYFGHKVF